MHVHQGYYIVYQDILKSSNMQQQQFNYQSQQQTNKIYNIVKNQQTQLYVLKILIQLFIFTLHYQVILFLQKKQNKIFEQDFTNMLSYQNFILRLFLQKVLSNKKLILSGDFFHVKASYLSSRLGYLEIPKYFSLIEENISKGMIIQEKLNQKMIEKQKVYANEIHQMIILRDTSLISYSLKCLGIIIHKDQQFQQDLFDAGVILGKLISLKNYMDNKDNIFLPWVNQVEDNQNVFNFGELQEQLMIQLRTQLFKLGISETKITEFIQIL
ncbi:hypothetical protein IMG5_109060 [Ichthyophthirius multifiliis]|uniref:Uncharacterized protein n=1 Tax=Ichthyophthirius multifiliis TaxID=5932 RepID=G0QTK6_ICHMU|nr:hypothetical protein IMG5_109060 [Ichthyophthirius multifiliis]EGR31457.1 hypothetical protein IMG5_109060 [Ichthyophthirius multifiliis]|eukprot:XP_004034943.1 hypothetical protein IMG5_109060 [Ichthyophthirius multifiliis]